MSVILFCSFRSEFSSTYTSNDMDHVHEMNNLIEPVLQVKLKPSMSTDGSEAISNSLQTATGTGISQTSALIY